MLGGNSNVPAFDYDPYGTGRLTTSLPTGFGYPGNASSGHYLRAFDPVGSRWPSRDPFGENTYVAKTLYPYVGGNPVSQTDRTWQSAVEKPSTFQNNPGSTPQMFAGSDRDAAWAKCHPRCVAQTVGKGLPDSFGSYRNCMRACMNSYGFFDY
jgi:RHS repeat-associated protein